MKNMKVSSRRHNVSSKKPFTKTENHNKHAARINRKESSVSLVEEDFVTQSPLQSSCCSSVTRAGSEQQQQQQQHEGGHGGREPWDGRKQRKEKAQDGAPTDVVNVIIPSTSTMLVIPREDIVHMPKGADENNKSQRLVLCDFFNPHVTGSCRAWSNCRWVHAITDRAKQKEVHYSHDWWEPSECPYERIKAEEGQTFTILQPTVTRGEVPPDEVPAELILKTRCVFEEPKRPAAHCAHFFYRRECHHGPECDFAHVIRPAGYHRQRHQPHPRRSRQQFLTYPDQLSPATTAHEFPSSESATASKSDHPLADDDTASPVNNSISTNTTTPLPSQGPVPIASSKPCPTCDHHDGFHDPTCHCHHGYDECGEGLYHPPCEDYGYDTHHPCHVDVGCDMVGTGESSWANFGVVRVSCADNNERWRYDPYYYSNFAQEDEEGGFNT